MLILTRRAGEAVMVGDEVKVVVLGAWGSQVRLGIDAPRTVAVHREEIYERVKREENVRPVEASVPDGSRSTDVVEELALLEKLRALAPERLAEVESFIDFLLKREGSASPGAWDGETEEP
jgi:carbon storage regulator